MKQAPPALDDPAQRRARNLQAVHDVSLIISEAIELQPTLERVCQFAVQLFGVDHSGLVQFHAGQSDGHVAAEYPPNGTRDEIIPIRGIPIEERLLQVRKPIVIDDVDMVDEAELGQIGDILRLYNIRSILLVPIISAGTVIGSFSLDWIGRTGTFDEEIIQLCQTFAAQAAVAIHRARLYSESRERIAVLEDVRNRTLDVAAQSDSAALAQTLVVQAKELLNARSAGLYINDAKRCILTIEAYAGQHDHLVGCTLRAGEGIAGRLVLGQQPYLIVADYHQAPEHASIYSHDHLFDAVIEVPLRWQNEVLGVLFVDDHAGRVFTEEDAQRLRLFSDHATLLLKNASLLTMHRDAEHRFERLLRMSNTLHDVSEALQRVKTFRDIVHVLLTGVTANYGLRFNRAAFLLYDHHTTTLQGEMAIGHYSREAAYTDWEQNPDDEPHAFQRYLDRLEEGFSPLLSALDERIRTLKIPLQGRTAFEQALTEGRIILLDRAGIECLPAAFHERFQPAMPLVVAPLIARKWPNAKWPIGIVVADNTFTAQVIDPAIYDALMSLCNTAALALDNYRLFERSERARDQMRSLFDASSALLNSSEPRRVLEDIVFRVKHVFDIEWVSAILIDGTSTIPHVADHVTTRQGHGFDGDHTIRAEGISMRVMREGKIARFENTAEYRDILNPFIFTETIGAAFCLPLKHNARTIGVMWLHCRHPRRLSRSEETAIQLYVNQATMAFLTAQRREDIELLHRASEEIGKAVTWEQVTEAICHDACTVLRAVASILWPFDAANDQFLPNKAHAKNISLKQWVALRAQPPHRGSRMYQVLGKQWDALETTENAADYVDEQFLQQLTWLDAESWQAVSLQLGGEYLGVLQVFYQQPRRFTESERQRALTFAGYAAHAMKKAALLEQVRDAHGTTSLIAKVNVMEQLDKTLPEIAKLVGRNFHADVVAVYAYDYDKQRLSMAPVQIGIDSAPHEDWSEKLPISPIVNAILDSDDITEIIDTRTHPLFKVSRFTREEGIRSCAAAPLRIGGKTVGAILLNYRSRHRLSPNELKAFKLVADQLAVAVRNDQLRRASDQRAATLDALHGAAQALLLLPSGDEMLQAIVEQAVNLVHERDGGYYSVLALYKDHRLQFVAASEPGMLAELHSTFPNGLNLAGDQIGVMGRAFVDRRTLNVFDVRSYSDFIPFVGTVTSQLAVPIDLGDQLLGVLSVEHSGRRAFTEDDKQALETLARYAAIAIRISDYSERPPKIKNDQHQPITVTSLQRSEFRRISHDALAAASLHNVLRMACEQIDQQMGIASSIRLYNPEREELEFDPHWSPSFDLVEPNRVLSKTYQKLSEGICGWVARCRRPYKVDDVTQIGSTGPSNLDIPSYIELNAKPFVVRSELAVPILYGSDAELIGVLDVQSHEPGRFSDDDMTFLELLADQLAVTIQMARQYDHLGTGMRSLLTWKSNLTASSAWWHSITKFAVQISNEVQALRAMPPEIPSSPDAQRFQQVLGRIDEHAQMIVNQPVPAQLGARDHIENIQVNWLIRNRIQRIQAYQQYEGVNWKLELDTAHEAMILASIEWLRHALDLLIDNAVKATKTRPQPTVTLITKVVSNTVRISVCDNGYGIPEHLRGRLFSEQIMSDGPGQGLGLLIVAVIARTYGGNAGVEHTSPDGTTMQIVFPSAR
jgi:GAF domain-containing protein